MATATVSPGDASPSGAARPSRPRTFLPGLPTWVIALGVVLLHLVVTFLVRPAPRWNDGIFVLNDARSFPHVPLDHHALRIGTILPTRLFLEVFGYGQVTYYAWPFLTGIMLVVAVLALGAVLFDRWVGAVAAVLLVFHPVLVDTVITNGTERMTSWQLLPDIPSTAFVTTGFALMIAATRREGRAATRWFLLAGFCFGWAYLVRELSVFFYPLVVAVLVVWRARMARWVQVALPMLGALVLEMVLAQWAHGDPLARLKVDGEHGSAPLSPITRLDALLRFPRIVEVYPQTLLVLTSFVLMVLGALVVRRREHVLLLGWFLVIWVPLTLVSGLLDPGFIRINASLMRYWVPVLPALVIGSTAFVAWLLVHLRRRLSGLGVGVTVAVAVLAVLVAAVPLRGLILDNPRDHSWNAVRAWLHTHDAMVSTIITDDRDALVLGIFSREPVGGGLVVHAKVRKVGHGLTAAPVGTGAPGTYLVWTPGLSRHAPRSFDGWRLLLREPQLRIYGPAR